MKTLLLRTSPKHPRGVEVGTFTLGGKVVLSVRTILKNGNVIQLNNTFGGNDIIRVYSDCIKVTSCGSNFLYKYNATAVVHTLKYSDGADICEGVLINISDRPIPFNGEVLFSHGSGWQITGIDMARNSKIFTWSLDARVASQITKTGSVFEPEEE